MHLGKIGLTIEDAAETTGIGRNTMRKLVEWGKLPTILEEDGYPDVQAFTATCRKAEKIVSQYNRDLAER